MEIVNKHIHYNKFDAQYFFQNDITQQGKK